MNNSKKEELGVMTREEILTIAKPILFNTDMVWAILEGRKTVTRRLIKPPYFVDGNEDDPRTLQVLRTAPKGSQLYREIGKMPYPRDPYRVGDYLYVRETWSTRQSNACMGNTTTGCPYDSCETASGPCFEDEYIYKATDSLDCHGSRIRKWHPSIHMPKEAARIFLRVTDVRMERLQDIDEEQSEKEGAINNIGFIHSPENEYDSIHTAKEHFMDVWDSTVQKRDIDKYGWNANPWVWAIEFERVEV